MNINRNPEFLSGEEEARGYRAIARLALFWGPIELLIEHMIVSLRNLHGETDQSFPVSFRRKIDELKDRSKREPELESFRSELAPLLGRSKELHVIRTHVVHSYFQGQNIDGQLMFGRSEQKRGVCYTEARYTPDQLNIATGEMMDIHDKVQPMALYLNSFFLSEIKRRNIEGVARASGSADQ